MLKRFLLAMATVACCSTSMFAQDFFLSFDNASLVTSTTIQYDETATAYLFADANFDVLGFQLGVTNSDVSVGALVADVRPAPALPGGEVFLSNGTAARFDVQNSPVTGPGTGIFGAATATTVLGIGPGSAFNALDTPVAGVGRLLGEVDIAAVGAGSTTITLDTTGAGAGFLLRDLSALPAGTTEITVGSGVTLNVESGVIPEPTSAGFLAMGLIGFMARRRR